MFSGIAITERLTAEERTCGVCVIDLRNGQVIGLLRFETAVQEVFAVTVLPGRRFPELINDDENLLENSFVVPDAALADVSPALRAGRERACANISRIRRVGETHRFPWRVAPALPRTPRRRRVGSRFVKH